MAQLTPHHALRVVERKLREDAQSDSGTSSLDPEVEQALILLWDVVVLGHAGQREQDDREVSR